MQRRLALILILALAGPSLALAQSGPRIFRVGRLAIGKPNLAAPLIVAQNEGLRELGFVEGQNVEFVFRWATQSVDELPALAAELVAEKVDVIWTGNNAATAAAVRASSRIPIVMTLGVDPVRNGFIDSFARPGRNVTGLTSDHGQEIHGKQLALLKELLPDLRRVAVLVMEGLGEDREAIDRAARQLGLNLVPVPRVRQIADLDGAFSEMKRGGAQAYLGIGGALLFSNRTLVSGLALRHQLPGVHWLAEYVADGALLSYGMDIVAHYRRSAWYVAQLLRGAKAAELPVEQLSRFETAINLRTARALGLKVPASLLARVDKVFE